MLLLFFFLLLPPLPPVAMATRRTLFALAVALLALSSSTLAVAGAETAPATTVQAASSNAIAPSPNGETQKAAPVTPASGVQVTVFRAAGWPAGTLTIPTAVSNDVSVNGRLF